MNWDRAKYAEAARDYHRERAMNGATPQSSWRENVIDAQDLCDRKFPELKWIVPGIFTEGINLLVSRPKLGKSWLLQQINTAVASGVSVLVSAEGAPRQGDVLYLSLEDGERRAQRRMTKYFGANRDNWPKLTIARKWRRLDQGGVDDLRDWCKSIEKPTLISIDTLKKVRPPKKPGQNDYDADYEACEGLRPLAEEFAGLAFIVAHHDRKMDADDPFDTVSGTLGLTGGVDTIAILKRTGQGVTLHVQGRDLLEDVEKAVRFDRETARWVILGEAAEVHRSADRTRVLDALKATGAPMAVSEIRGAADLKNKDAAYKLLQRMAAAGEIRRCDHGKYGLPSGGVSNLSKCPNDEKTPENTGEKQGFGQLDNLDTPQPNGSLGKPALGPGGPDDDLAHLVHPLDIPPFLDRRREPEPEPRKQEGESNEAYFARCDRYRATRGTA